MRQYLLFILFVTFAVIGCSANPDSHVACRATPSTNPDDYVGGYVFTPHDADRGQFADFVILDREANALEIRFSKTDGQVVFVQQCWHLEPGGHQGNLVIAKRAYPIERSGATIKLGINKDLDENYAKVR